MFAQQLLSNEVFPLKKSDTSEAALHFMQDWNVRNLPVIENGKLLGYVDENSLSDDNKKIETFLSTQEPIRLKPDTHLFEILKIIDTFLLCTYGDIVAVTFIGRGICVIVVILVH
jgi:CBS-domain-containing membrane protein